VGAGNVHEEAGVVISVARATRVMERNGLAYRRMWALFLAGFFEPLLFLLSIGIGVGGLVGKVAGPHATLVTYQEFVAPGMLAAAAMNGAVLDTTFSFFVKFKYMGTFDTMLATPMTIAELTTGEVGWGLLRGGIYSAVFLLTMMAMGLVHSAWAVLAVPAAVLVSLAFGGLGVFATTFMRSFVDFDYVNLAVAPMFLLSATFFPLQRYPHALQTVVRLTPLYQGVALERGLILGAVDASLAFHALYLVALGAAGITVGVRRLGPLLQP
jgi:lipooligosaccharide transport system permease protein